jgi:hypothetical protein
MGLEMAAVAEGLVLGLTAPAQAVSLHFRIALSLLPALGIALFVRDDYLLGQRDVPGDCVRPVLRDLYHWAGFLGHNQVIFLRNIKVPFQTEPAICKRQGGHL